MKAIKTELKYIRKHKSNNYNISQEEGIIDGMTEWQKVVM